MTLLKHHYRWSHNCLSYLHISTFDAFDQILQILPTYFAVATMTYNRFLLTSFSDCLHHQLRFFNIVYLSWFNPKWRSCLLLAVDFCIIFDEVYYVK